MDQALQRSDEECDYSRQIWNTMLVAEKHHVNQFRYKFGNLYHSEFFFYFRL